VQLLRELRVRQNARRLALGTAWKDSGKVFTYDDGSPLRPSWITKRFKKLYAAAGLPPIRLHDMRHTAATLMLAAKVEMKVVQETLGHSTLATTSDVYTSVLPGIAKAAADAAVALVPRKASRTSPAGVQSDQARITQEINYGG
jgi:integrase